MGRPSPPPPPPFRHHGRSSGFRGTRFFRVASFGMISVYGEQSVVDYFGGVENVPAWCRGCDHPDYLPALRRQMVRTIYSPMRWIMQGFVAMTAKDYEFAFFSLAVGRRLGELAETGWDKQADIFLGQLRETHPPAERYLETHLPVIWQPYSTVVLDFLAKRLLPVVVEKRKRLLNRNHLVVFTQALATNHDHINRPAQLVPNKLLALPGLARAEQLRECWRSGYFKDSFESIEARRNRHSSTAWLDMRLTYVRNHKVASTAVMGLLEGRVGGPTPYHLGRSAFPGHTWFAFVRDPVRKLVSAFFEINRPGLNLCGDTLTALNNSDAVGGSAGSTAKDSGFQDREDHPRKGRNFCQFGMNPWNAAADSEVDKEEVMERFLAMLADLEARTFGDQHTDSQAERLLLFPDKDGTIDFIGEYTRLQEDWKDLETVQLAAFNLSLPALPERLHVTKPSLYQVINASSISIPTAQRICDLYRTDYCCLGLPIPPACRKSLTC